MGGGEKSEKEKVKGEETENEAEGIPRQMSEASVSAAERDKRAGERREQEEKKQTKHKEKKEKKGKRNMVMEVAHERLWWGNSDTLKSLMSDFSIPKTSVDREL